MTIDLVAIGRANLDLYSQSIGAAFEDATGFDAMVGGSPTNIAIGVRRLGLSSAILTAVGDDRTGDFVLRYLRDEGVITDHIPRVVGKHTSLALLGVRPPDDFPLSFYRDDPADIYLDRSTVAQVDMAAVRAIEVSGNALSRGPCVDAVHALLDGARAHAATSYMDVDLRPSEWPRPEAFGEAIRSVLDRVDVLIGTEEELAAAFLDEPSMVMGGAPIAPAMRAELADAVAGVLEGGPRAVVTKRGQRGCTIATVAGALDVGGFDVAVVNTVGAGDAFAAGLIRSRLLGLDWPEAARFANACGALVVGRHGCSSALPTTPEVDAFLAGRAGA